MPPDPPRTESRDHVTDLRKGLPHLPPQLFFGSSALVWCNGDTSTQVILFHNLKDIQAFSI